jgi:hypothetical protein
MPTAAVKPPSRDRELRVISDLAPPRGDAANPRVRPVLTATINLEVAHA